MAVSLRSAKQRLRKSIRETLNHMTALERKDQSLRLVEEFMVHPAYQEANRISVYLSMPLEVDTTAIIEDIFKKGKLCYIPRFSSDRMDMLRTHSLEDISSLPVYKWGIKQPSFDEDREDAIKSGGLDLVLVPGLGFTEDGQRLGQGKGYYDNFLSQCSKAGITPVTIALAFGVQKFPELPTGPTDVQINHVIFS